jgi:hypothetical protein
MKISIVIENVGTDSAIDDAERLVRMMRVAAGELPNVPAACSTVAVDPHGTVTDTSPAPTTAFAQSAPPPAPVAPPAAPTSPPPAPPATSGAIELDSEGLPWDGRIHASSKAKVGNGAWRTRRNLDAATHDRIKAELKAAMGAPTLTAPADWATPHVTPVPPAPAVTEVFPPLPPILATPAAPAIPPAPPVAPVAPVTTGPITFPILIQKITAMSATNPADTASRVTAAVQRVGLPSLPLLASRPDLIPQVAADLGITQ